MGRMYSPTGWKSMPKCCCFGGRHLAPKLPDTQNLFVATIHQGQEQMWSGVNLSLGDKLQVLQTPEFRRWSYPSPLEPRGLYYEWLWDNGHWATGFDIYCLILILGFVFTVSMSWFSLLEEESIYFFFLCRIPVKRHWSFKETLNL